MKARFSLGGSLFLILSLSISLVSAQNATSAPSCNVATLFNAWSAASPAGAPNGVIYGLLTNLSNQPDTLVSATTDAAEAVEFHQTVMGSGDVMQMQPAQGGITVAAQNYQELKPGGYHIMLVNLKHALVAGESLNLTLTFEHIGDVKTTVPIVDASQTENSMSGMSSDMAMEPAATADSMGSMSMMATATAPTPMTMWPTECARIHVIGAWARPAGPGTPNSAAYTLLVNLTGSEDILQSVSTTAASAELHEMKMGSGDVMQMTPIEGGIVIPAGGAVILQPGGKHIMLIGLTQELASGTTLDLTFTFEHSGQLKLSVPVQPPPDTTMPMQPTPTTTGG